MAKSPRRSSGPVLPIRSSLQRSVSPPGRFSTSSAAAAAASSFASSTNSSFSPATYYRSTSPTRVNLHGRFAPATSSVRFSIDRSSSPGRSMAVTSRDHVVRKQNNNSLANIPKKTCMCSPTNHPGSFRCSLHKNFNNSHSMTYSPNRLNARRSAMTNSLVRIGTVEGDLVKRALAALIRPSSHQQRRRAGFEPRPSRLSVMSKAEEN
ncbi:Serine-rich protein-related [Heracleum sosnowskyi]|uniref:Serine-rich protein-related n=1 Tax=Heracleum sosnowskyi TaxID=360622 RepID=A0AAD8MY74_9APIA|nr:Serine-rich protein-related [Heracleum sosnowskyi]